MSQVAAYRVGARASAGQPRRSAGRHLVQRLQSQIGHDIGVPSTAQHPIHMHEVDCSTRGMCAWCGAEKCARKWPKMMKMMSKLPRLVDGNLAAVDLREQRQPIALELGAPILTQHTGVPSTKSPNQGPTGLGTEQSISHGVRTPPCSGPSGACGQAHERGGPKADGCAAGCVGCTGLRKRERHALHWPKGCQS